MTNETTQPKPLEVSSHFFHDASDFELRYRFCMESEGPLFWATKSSRMKCFLDLRMGIESVLKSIVCYHEHNGRCGKRLVNWIEGYGHRIDRLLRKAKPYIDEDILEKYEDDLMIFGQLPVGLRYRMDAWDFSSNKEELYYDTIGSDLWLQKMNECLKTFVDYMNKELGKHSRVVNVADIVDEIFEPRHEKYI